MSTNLIVAAVLFSLFIIFFIIVLLRKKKVNIKYSLIWILLFLVLLVSTVVPGFLLWVTKILGFQTASNMVISIILAVLVVISIALTVIVSNQDKKIRLLIQEISILKKEFGDNNEK